MDEILELVVPNIVVWCAVFGLLALDERWMTDDQRARAWPTASRRIAVVMFSPFCVPLHFVRTRRTAWGVVLAVGWTAALLVVLACCDLVLSLVLPDA